MLQIPHTPNFITVQNIIKMTVNKKYEQMAEKQTENKTWVNLNIGWGKNKNTPRKASATFFHLNTAHDCLAAHLQRINICIQFSRVRNLA